jgi:hypothetical protein
VAGGLLAVSEEIALQKLYQHLTNGNSPIHACAKAAVVD